MKQRRLVVIGGGAAGFFCAVNAARLHPALEVILLEKTGKLLSKVKVSGGGRCNVTHAAPDLAYMAKRYPRGQHFVKKAFGFFFVPDTIAWFAERGVALKAEADNRMFPVTDSSQTIIDCLLQEADRYGVRVRTNSEVLAIRKAGAHTLSTPPGNTGWIVELGQGNSLEADAVCIAAGGYAQAAKFGWLQALGHHIAEPVPSLFTFNMPHHPITALMGVSVPEVQVKIAGSKLQEQGPVLITHWGLSGPAVLRLSAWGARELFDKNYTFTAIINWTPAYHETSMRETLQAARSLGGQKLHGKNQFGLPQRLWQFLLLQAGIPEDMRWADMPAKAQLQLTKLLTAMECPVSGKTTFKEEFVTCGGIQLPEVDPNTMESKKAPGLFFAGEVLDVDGITGGFNFQHAWTSGMLAAKHCVK
ncbi:hypothetical protein GA0116948_10995 [Chitinophaga costaii]|uniref:Flavoprotein, HI0933 family n=1 Tax=Chitinophaga costaii TaxID=1335309 RepID=A0A1C4EPL8_9BACT|nr:NAD(P)/FAD-dependent oxidoreductase [Chitinophaga costaii]PUZ22498.1 NAD(P)/FAD-dependent oxidoreductase [Chitinophaga costaii]SCC45538.1 hypothetical protein GA0116948_10995 [Chitinophaga costaii]